MIEWLIIIAYIGGFFYSWWRVSGYLAWHFGSNPPQGDDYAFATFLGFLGAWAWPIFLPITMLSEKNDGLGGMYYVPRKHRLPKKESYE